MRIPCSVFSSRSIAESQLSQEAADQGARALLQKKIKGNVARHWTTNGGAAARLAFLSFCFSCFFFSLALSLSLSCLLCLLHAWLPKWPRASVYRVLWSVMLPPEAAGLLLNHQTTREEPWNSSLLHLPFWYGNAAPEWREHTLARKTYLPQCGAFKTLSKQQGCQSNFKVNDPPPPPPLPQAKRQSTSEHTTALRDLAQLVAGRHP